jgi:DNA-binding winged helix-turn-helix (wHTH) protein
VHVAEVRKKLADDGPQVETIRGLGYRLVPPRRGSIPEATDQAGDPAAQTD